MNKLLMTVSLIAFAVPATAAEKMSRAGVPAGTYCQVIEPEFSEGWMYFTRGKCAPDAELSTLTLKTNGNFSLGGIGDEMECRVNPKSYFKGWADYDCKKYGAKVFKSKHNFKFTTQDDGTLGLSEN